MTYIRTKKIGGKYEYRQLVETYREDGKHRQRVLAHLGKHETLEEAIDAARAKVEVANSEKFREAIRRTEGCERTIRRRYSEQLERYHGGEIPSSTTVGDRARLRPVPRDARGDNTEVEVPVEVEEYRRAFGDVGEGVDVTYSGSRMHYRGFLRFRDDVQSYEYWSEKAERLEHTYNRRKARLEKLEAVLDSERKARLDKLEAKVAALGGGD